MARGQYGLQRVVNLATALLDGLMSKADKAKLDASTSAYGANTLVQRSADGSIGVGNLTTAGAATIAGAAAVGQGISAKNIFIGGAGAAAANLLVLQPGSDAPAQVVLYGTNAAGGLIWYIRQDGYFQGTAANAANVTGSITGNAATATALSAGPTKDKLDAIDPSTSYPVVNALQWSKTQVATNRYMFTTQVGFTLAAAVDQIPVLDVTTPSSKMLNAYDFFVSYCGRNGGKINAAVRPVGNAEPNFGAQNQFQVHVSTMVVPPDNPVNLNTYGTTGVVLLMFIER